MPASKVVDMTLALSYIKVMARKFPIGIQTFAEIREKGAIYVDKTDLIYKLANDGKVYFLSRPRRFGKSLLIDTLAEYFSGNKELFTGLAIDKLETEWKKHPLLRFDFSKKKYLRPEMLDESLDKMLSSYEDIYGRNPKDKTPSSRLDSLIVSAEKMSGQKVVFLVDEYDAPLLDTLVDKDSFEKMRQTLRDFYSPLKANDAHIKFIFITGIKHISLHVIPASERESPFLGHIGWAGLNHLHDISMLDEYASICGITEDEMKTQMKPEVQVFADAVEKNFEQACVALKQKYDGYHFSPKSPDIYNPYSLLNALQDRTLKNYWFETGTPTFLVEQIRNYTIDPIAFETGIQVTEDEFNVPAEYSNNPIPVLYQSGYLTIKGFDKSKFLPYTLAYPNEEVREGFIKGLLKNYSGQEATAYNTVANTIIDGFNSGDVDSVMDAIKAYLSDVPYDAAKRDERFYRTLIFGVFYLATPFLVECERKSARGRADIIVETKTAVYAIEFKLDGSIDEAFEQIDDRGYLEPYRNHRTEKCEQKMLYKVAVNIDSAKRTLGEWKIVAGC